MTEVAKLSVWQKPGLWAGLMFATLGIIAGLKFSGAVERGPTYLLLIVPLLLGAQFYRSLQNYADACGAVSPALKRYNKGIAITSLGYMIGLGIAMTLWKRYELSDAAIFGIALLPAIPTFAMIAVMGRYITDEQDEYLRHRAMIAAVWGLGIVLALGTFWGFMEMFGLVPHIWSWWVLPVWAIGMGLGQLVQRDRAS